ncbi:hypothetical protein CCAX7_002600 [Capsulimonas corticalis]|uniref:Uncharacterized protein n=1 Tax=Capsulimonas corticalis TaxID=2219043 RepID=A0A402CRT3_9BACT|nr:DUF3466 family protein [Capsulimonas corticalis]BDI28209.1 hypothetical protein CCAX7_002600 [Capsulimonas corticalis]
MKNYRLSQWLTVLVVIAIPAFILLPVVRRHKNDERAAICPSNLQILGKALAMYLADNDQAYPPAYSACFGNDRAAHRAAWTSYLDPYVSAKIDGGAGWVISTGWSILENAPGDASKQNVSAASGPWRCPNDADDAVLSYGLNPMVSGAYKQWNCGSEDHEPEWQDSLKTSDVQNPGQIVWGGDTNRYWDPTKNKYTAVFPEWPRKTDLYLRNLTKPQLVEWYRSFLSKDFTDIKDQCSYPLAWGCRAPSYRHDRSVGNPGAAAMLFCDGHVRAVPFGKLSVENIFPDLASVDQNASAPSPVQYPYRIVDLGFAFHAGAVNNDGLVVGGTQGHVFAFQGGKQMDLKRPSIANSATAYAVNSAGEIAGNFASTEASGAGDSDHQYGFIWRGGKYQNLQYPEGYDGFLLRGINRKGQAVGRAYRGSSAAFDGSSRAFLWENGKFRDLGIPTDCISSAAYAINDQGQVVGSAVTRDNHTHAIAWRNGSITDLGTLPGGSLSAAYGINDQGQIVGDSNTGKGDVRGMHPVLWENGKIVDLGLPVNCRSCVASAISNSGLVATLLSDLDGVPMAVGIWDKKNGMRSSTALTPPDSGFLLRDVYSINDKGQCVCRAFYGNDTNRMALLTPVQTYAAQCAANGVRWP